MPKHKFCPRKVSDISVQVYRVRLDRASGAGASERMIAKDGDTGVKLRKRAASYDSLTRDYLTVLGVKP